MTNFRVVDGGKKPISIEDLAEALSDTDYAESIRRLVRLDGEMKASLEDLRVINAHVAIQAVAASRGINGTIEWLKGELRHLERLGESVR